MVYWDESYIHQNHDIRHGWGEEPHGSGKGERLILCHALTRDGLICGQPVNDQNPSFGKKGVNHSMPQRLPKLNTEADVADVALETRDDGDIRQCIRRTGGREVQRHLCALRKKQKFCQTI